MLRDWFHRTARGVGVVAVLTGEAGIGKTRLLTEAVERERDRGLDVRFGTAHEFDPRPLAPLAEALGLDFAEASTVPVEVADARATSDAVPTRVQHVPYGAMEQCLGAIEEAASVQPTVVTIDDVQWADEATLAVVRALARRASRLPLAVVTSLRPWPRSQELARMLDDFGALEAQELVVGPLTEDEATALVVDALGGARPGPRLLEQIEGTGGNPFFIAELLAALADEGVIDQVEGLAEVGDARLPAGLREIVLRRLASLPDDSIEVLQVAAVLGPVFHPTDLAIALRRPAVELVQPLERARHAGVLREDGDRLGFRHDLVREAIYRDLPDAVRQALHADVGRALAASGATAQGALHLAVGAQPLDRAAVELLREAARELTAREPNVAVGLLERATELASDVRDAELTVEHVHALLAAGRARDAEALATPALAGAAEPHATELRFGLAGAQFLQGQPALAASTLERVLASGGLRDDRAAVARADIATGHLWTFDLPRAQREAELAVTEGGRLQNASALVGGLTVLCRISGLRVEYERAIGFGERAVQVASGDGEALRRTPHTYLSLALLGADRHVDAVAVCEEGRRYSEEIGAGAALPRFHHVLLLCAWFSGRWDDALAEAESARTLLDDFGLRSGGSANEAIRGLVAFHRGDTAAARTALEVAEAEAAVPGSEGAGLEWLIRLRGALRELDGDPAGAAGELIGVFDLATALGVRSIKLWLGPSFVLTLLAAGEHERTRAVAAELEELVSVAATPTARGAARHARGLVDHDAHALVSAVGCYRDSGRPFDLMLACESAGRCLGAQQRRDEAVAMLTEALGIADGLHAAHDTRRISAELRSLGVRLGASGRRERPTSGWESLTPAELTVADLVANGLTNPEIAARLFVARRTVSTHVSHIFAKLGIRSRVELAAEVLRQDRAHSSAP